MFIWDDFCKNNIFFNRYLFCNFMAFIEVLFCLVSCLPRDCIATLLKLDINTSGRILYKISGKGGKL